MPQDNQLLHVHKSHKVTNVYCRLSQRTTRRLKIKNKNTNGLIHNQPLLKTIFTKAPIISYKKKKIPERHACEGKNIL